MDMNELDSEEIASDGPIIPALTACIKEYEKSLTSYQNLMSDDAIPGSMLALARLAIMAKSAQQTMVAEREIIDQELTIVNAKSEEYLDRETFVRFGQTLMLRWADSVTDIIDSLSQKNQLPEPQYQAMYGQMVATLKLIKAMSIRVAMKK